MTRKQMRSLGFFLALALVATSGTWISAQDGGDGLRRPLDLPSGGIGGDDDEDAPESITFYGAEFEAEAFFWCVDRSGSMDGPPIATLKAEMTDALNQLSRRAQFGLVRFSTAHDVWRPRPVRANTANKGIAIAWIQEMSAFGWTCMPDAVAAICDISNQCNLRNKTIILVGDGMPLCGSATNLLTSETLQSLASHNYKRTPVNTIFISANSDGVAFFREIAQLYGGKFININ